MANNEDTGDSGVLFRKMPQDAAREARSVHSFFSGDNPFFRLTGMILDVAVLSLLWLVCCLPVVTIGPATAALYYSCVKCLRFHEPGPYGSFFSALRENLGTGVGFTLVFAAVAALLRWGYGFLTGILPEGETWSAVMQIAYLLLALLPVGAFSAGAALLSRFQYTVRGLLSDSIRIVFRHFPRVFLAAVLNAAAVFLGIRYFYYMVWLILPALEALLVSLVLEPLLRQYTPQPEGEEELDPEDLPWYLR